MNTHMHTRMMEHGFADLSDWPRPLAYLLAAMVCAFLCRSESLGQRTPARVRQLWWCLCPLYLLAAGSALLQGDVRWVRWARAFAREHDAYSGRYVLQLATLLTLAMLLAAGWKQQHRARQGAGRTSLARSMVLAGACSTLALHLLRYVSFHYTDLALNATWLGHSMGTWAEGLSLGTAGVGTSLEILRSYGHV